MVGVQRARSDCLLERGGTLHWSGLGVSPIPVGLKSVVAAYCVLGCGTVRKRYLRNVRSRGKEDGSSACPPSTTPPSALGLGHDAALAMCRLCRAGVSAYFDYYYCFYVLFAFF